MKHTLILSTLLSLAMICSCQKQDPTVEAQLSQRKTELDAREEALVQREKAVEQREKAVAERERAVGTNRLTQSRPESPDAAQAEAERQRRIQQLPPELRALIPDRSRLDAARAEKQAMTQDHALQTQRMLDDARKKMSALAAQGNAPATQDTSPSPSPTPQ